VCESPERADRRGVARRGADVGADEESGHRRRAAIEAFAVVLDRVEDHGVRVAPVEDASRSARSPTCGNSACLHALARPQIRQRMDDGAAPGDAVKIEFSANGGPI
jgi:hypothetical protein